VNSVKTCSSSFFLWFDIPTASWLDHALTAEVEYKLDILSLTSSSSRLRMEKKVHLFRWEAISSSSCTAKGYFVRRSVIISIERLYIKYQ
jgi:hypothetical protein